MGGGNVIEVHSKAEWNAKLAENAGKAIIVDFTATWCGPCQQMAPVFVALSEEFTSVVFLKVDVDAVSDVAGDCGVSAMPTFQVWQDGKKVEELIGAQRDKLKALVQKYA